MDALGEEKLRGVERRDGPPQFLEAWVAAAAAVAAEKLGFDMWNDGSTYLGRRGPDSYWGGEYI
jgi:hypothetical protein